MKKKRTEADTGDLFAREPVADSAAPERRIYTVSEIMSEAKSLMEETYPDVCVRGEVTGYMMASSGHIYFDIKDEGALLRVVFFKGNHRNLKFTIENGMEVLVSGNLSIYEGRSSFQMKARMVEPAGLGALQMRIEQLKKKLEAEGLFSVERKRSIPDFPMSIALVTSPEGAAVRDFLKVTRRRFPGQRIVIFPALVQGDEAPREIVAAIEAANEMGGFDVMVVCRGGGSLEDLMAFNDEGVARAIASSAVPVVTGIGHERDFTIADFVADVRAATPSQAAEFVTPSREDLFLRMEDLTVRMGGFVRSLLDDLAQELDDASVELKDAVRGVFSEVSRTLGEHDAKLRMLSPRKVLAGRKDLLAQLAGRLAAGAKARGKAVRGTLEAFAGKLHAMSPLAVLGRGYSICFTMPERRIVKEAGKVAPGSDVLVRLWKGSLKATIRSADEEEK